jgi:hypothetical protein
VTRELVEIVAQYALFLERADESEIPLEVAVRQQEDLAFRLQRLSPVDRQEFVRLLVAVAKDVPTEGERQILLRLPDDVGIR